MSIRYSKYLPAIVFTTDVLLLNIAFFIAYIITWGLLGFTANTINLLILVNLTWMPVALVSRSMMIRRPLSLMDNINKFILTLIYHLLLVLSFFYFFKLFDYSRIQLVLQYGLFLCFVVIARSVAFFLLDYLRKKGFNHRQIIIIGDSIIADRLLKSFKHHPEYGYDLTNFILEESVFSMTEDQLKQTLLVKKPDEIFICYREIKQDFLNMIIKLGNDYLIKIKVVSDLTLGNNAAQLVNYNDLPILQLTSHPEIAVKIRVLKRSFDIIFSSAVMIGGAPVFILLYIVTKLTSPGPAFYKQQRVGRNEKPFFIYKFRSMYIDSEKCGPQLAFDNDPRITKWGKIIRKTRLDELPQFWNVLKGEMSVVGPRPERQHYIEQILEKTPNYKRLLVVKPGLTSIGQVYYGYAENVNQMRDRSRYDLIYLQNMSLNSDFNIILKTVKVMVQRKGK